MCGIMGVAGRDEAVPVLLDGLRHLSYRGYDAAGVAVQDSGAINIRKKAGSIEQLAALLAAQPVKGGVGIGHTRWATHGEVTDANAHPHLDPSGRVAVVHNGIIENEQQLRRELLAKGMVFRSETDSELIASLIAGELHRGPRQALRYALSRLTGAYALAVLFSQEPDSLYAARRDSPLVIGRGKNVQYLASDIPALSPYVESVSLMEDGDIARLRLNDITLWDEKDREVSRDAKPVAWERQATDKGCHEHFMAKEIAEQPDALARLGDAPLAPWPLAKHIYLVGCGSAYHACLCGRHYAELLAGVPAEAEIASEFRFRELLQRRNALCVTISQSGETADSLAALRRAKAEGLQTAAIVNVPESSIARESAQAQAMLAGPEMAVATTKGYTTQLLALLRLSLALGMENGHLSGRQAEHWRLDLGTLPALADRVLSEGHRVVNWAKLQEKTEAVFFIGRGLDHATALEGSLKLQELSYIPSHAFPAGELKHGAMALVEPGSLLVAVCTQEAMVLKTLANIREIKARGSQVLALCRETDAALLRPEVDELWVLPTAPDPLMPILSILPLQQWAYEMARLRGCSIDKPRNLAKSVTVE